jgi:hypothetical protein
MHPTLTYQLQKAITQERLHSAALTQRARFAQVDRRPRLAAEMRQPSRRGFRSLLGLLGPL